MRALSKSELRTIRIAGAVLGAYFILFTGQKALKFLNQRRLEYHRLVQESSRLRTELRPYRDKVLVTKKMMEDSRLDPARLSRALVVSEASAAIFKAAANGGVGLGPIRETAGRKGSSELASIQLDCTGPIGGVMAFLHGFAKIGYPIIIDSVQLTMPGPPGGPGGPGGPGPMPGPAGPPGMVKAHLALIILDFEQWKITPEVPNG
jgi:hypothetical protein